MTGDLASTLLGPFAEAFARHQLDAVLMGSAALLLHGVEIRPHDVDFLFHDTPAQRTKLAAVARDLGATVTRPYYRLSLRWHFAAPDADFVCAVDGVSAADLRARASLHACGLLVASRADVEASRAAADHVNRTRAQIVSTRPRGGARVGPHDSSRKLRVRPPRSD